jgi:secreted trypsin-like serine protease
MVLSLWTAQEELLEGKQSFSGRPNGSDFDQMSTRNVVEPHSHPYQAGLIVQVSLIVQRRCGGSLITSQAVLTSAHCIENSLHTQIVLGAHTINQIEDTQQRFRNWILKLVTSSFPGSSSFV